MKKKNRSNLSKQERQQMNVLEKDRVIPTNNNKLVKISNVHL